MPSNHSSTHGSVLISTRPIDSSRIDSAPRNWPKYEPVDSPEGRATIHRTASATTRTAIVAGPISRAAGRRRIRATA